MGVMDGRAKEGVGWVKKKTTKEDTHTITLID
jgi:hypothetical protein